MLFDELVDSELDEVLKPVVANLVKKKTVPELELIPRIEEINQYIETNLQILEVTEKSLLEEKDNSWQDLNQLFLSLIKK